MMAVRGAARRWSIRVETWRMPRRSRTEFGMREAQVKSPGPTNTHCRMIWMPVLAAQYNPRPAGASIEK